MSREADQKQNKKSTSSKSTVPEMHIFNNHLAEKLLKTTEVADILGIGKSTLEQDRIFGRMGIPFVRLGRSIRYRWSDVKQYLDSMKTFTSTSESGEDR